MLVSELAKLTIVLLFEFASPRTTVPVEGVPPTTLVGLTETLWSGTGLIVSEAFTLLPLEFT
jgi:hypothetical protein